MHNHDEFRAGGKLEKAESRKKLALYTINLYSPAVSCHESQADVRQYSHSNHLTVPERMEGYSGLELETDRPREPGAVVNGQRQRIERWRETSSVLTRRVVVNKINGASMLLLLLVVALVAAPFETFRTRRPCIVVARRSTRILVGKRKTDTAVRHCIEWRPNNSCVIRFTGIIFKPIMFSSLRKKLNVTAKAFFLPIYILQ